HVVVTLVATFAAHALRHAFDLLDVDVQVQIVEQVRAAVGERAIVRAGPHDLALQRGAPLAAINPQTLGLREKKTADNGGSRWLAHATRPRPHPSDAGAGHLCRGRVRPRRRIWGSSGSRLAVPLPCWLGVAGRRRASSRTAPDEWP